MKILAYTYDADIHCIECSKKKFGPLLMTAGGERGCFKLAVGGRSKDKWIEKKDLDENNIPFEQKDSEGNLIRPVFSLESPECCGDCHEKII